MKTLRTARITLLLATGAIAAGCGVTDTTNTDAPLDQRWESAHGIYLFAQGDAVDTVFQETYYVWLFNQLGVTPSEPLEYHKYLNVKHLESITGRITDGYTETGTLTFHTIWGADNHQSVHAVLSTLVGHPPAIINEGIATALQIDPLHGDFVPRWHGSPLDDVARFSIQGGDLPLLDDLLVSADFFNYDRDVVFPAAGSFVHFLLDDYGYQPLLDLVAQADYNDTAADLRATYEAILGEAIDSSWTRWRRWLIP